MSDDMHGRVVLITGANTGIGFATARALGEAGARVVLHGRDVAKVEAAVATLAGEGLAVEPVTADLASLDQVARLARVVRERHPVLDVLVNNAGLMRDRLELTTDGYETVFQVNHLAPFLLTHLLRPALEAAKHPRVVTVASGAHGMAKDVGLDDITKPRRYDATKVYARSKACNILFNQELARRAPGLEATAMHPGLVKSAFAQDGDVEGFTKLIFVLARPFMKTPEKGADTVIWLARGGAGESGGYYIRRRPSQPRSYARDPLTAQALWALSERLVEPHLQAEDAHG